MTIRKEETRSRRSGQTVTQKGKCIGTIVRAATPDDQPEAAWHVALSDPMPETTLHLKVRRSLARCSADSNVQALPPMIAFVNTQSEYYR